MTIGEVEATAARTPETRWGVEAAFTLDVGGRAVRVVYTPEVFGPGTARDLFDFRGHAVSETGRRCVHPVRAEECATHATPFDYACALAARRARPAEGAHTPLPIHYAIRRNRFVWTPEGYALVTGRADAGVTVRLAARGLRPKEWPEAVFAEEQLLRPFEVNAQLNCHDVYVRGVRRVNVPFSEGADAAASITLVRDGRDGLWRSAFDCAVGNSHNLGSLKLACTPHATRAEAMAEAVALIRSALEAAHAARAGRAEAALAELAEWSARALKNERSNLAANGRGGARLRRVRRLRAERHLKSVPAFAEVLAVIDGARRLRDLDQYAAHLALDAEERPTFLTAAEWEEAKLRIAKARVRLVGRAVVEKPAPPDFPPETEFGRTFRACLAAEAGREDGGRGDWHYWLGTLTGGQILLRARARPLAGGGASYLDCQVVAGGGWMTGRELLALGAMVARSEAARRPVRFRSAEERYRAGRVRSAEQGLITADAEIEIGGACEALDGSTSRASLIEALHLLRFYTERGRFDGDRGEELARLDDALARFACARARRARRRERHAAADDPQLSFTFERAA